MIIFDTHKLVKRENGKVYLTSRLIDFGLFCDYSEKEDLVRIEEHSGARSWYDIAPFFWNYPVRVGRLIGVAIGNKVLTYQIKSIEPRDIRRKSILYALISPCGGERPLNFEKDYPLNQLEHDLAIDRDDESLF